MLSLIRGNRRRPNRPTPRPRRAPPLRGPGSAVGGGGRRRRFHDDPDPATGLTRTGIYALVVLVAVLNKASSLSGGVFDGVGSRSVPKAPQRAAAVKPTWGWEVYSFDPDPYLFKSDWRAYMSKKMDETVGTEEEKRMMRRKLKGMRKQVRSGDEERKTGEAQGLKGRSAVYIGPFLLAAFSPLHCEFHGDSLHSSLSLSLSHC